jgi:pyruvate formate lyase activating enzyme
LESVHAREVTVEELVAEVRACLPYVSGVTVSGGEATLQADFVGAFFAALKADSEAAHLTTMIDSNGSADEATWRALAPVTDGVMVDLKALDDRLHRRMTGQSNAPVLESIRLLHRLDLLHEVRLLLVPGLNDDDATLEATAAWLLAVDPAIRVRLNRFLHHGVRAEARSWPEASADDVGRWRGVLENAGITTG